jgi:hypothetical protein
MAIVGAVNGTRSHPSGHTYDGWGNTLSTVLLRVRDWTLDESAPIEVPMVEGRRVQD